MSKKYQKLITKAVKDIFDELSIDINKIEINDNIKLPLIPPVIPILAIISFK